MKARLLKLTTIIILLFSLSFPVSARNSYYGDNYLNTTSSSSTTINNMDYEMTVNENHSYNIKVHETVTFHSPHHGIYRAYAKEGTFYRQIDGKNIESKYNAKITDVKVESGQPYSTDIDGDAFIIKIGNPNQYVSGKQEYTYSFRYDPGDDGINAEDDVYQNILSPYMEDTIEHIHVTVKMPKPFDSKDVMFTSGEYGTTELGSISYSVDGTTINAENKSPLPPGTVLTLRVTLPEGYFVGASRGDQYFVFYYVAAAAAVILALIIYFIKGRGKKPLEPVSFYPPDGLDSAQVGYVLTNCAKDKYLVSLIIYFADKGWITIENTSSSTKNSDFYLHKIAEIPPDRPLFERTIFNAIFSRSNSPSIKALTRKRYMGESFISAKQQLSDWFKGSNKLLSNSAIQSKSLITIFVLISSAIFSFASTYFLERGFDIFSFVFFFIFSLLGTMILGYSSSKQQIGLGILFIVLVAFISYLFVQSIPMAATLFVSSLLMGLLIKKSDRRTEKGMKWLGECLGFRHFIKTAELDQLKLLVEENPEYYYKTLPFAYAMDLTDVWAKNFEGIAINPPDWYIDPYNNFNLFTYMYMMNTFHHGVARTITGINTQGLRGMGSGGFGGGFTGGGFGGGGGGGMGGGSW